MLLARSTTGTESEDQKRTWETGARWPHRSTVTACAVIEGEAHPPGPIGL
jgi:hypothetical protein